MKLTFDTNNNEKQKQAVRCWLNDDIFEVVYGGAKGGGKSYLGVNLIFGDAFIYPETHYFIARKRISDITKHTIPSIYEVFNSWGIDKRYYNYNGQANIFTLHNGSRVLLIEAKYMPGDPLYERFGSMQMTRGWIEEGGEFNETAATNLKISIGRWKNDQYNLAPKLLTTCNPKKNYLYRNIYKPSMNGGLPKDTAFIQALIQDNKTLPELYVKNLFDTLKGSERQRLLFGNWEYDDDPNSLIESYDAIIDLFTNKVKDGKRYIVCDAARFGSDKAVIIVFNGYRAIDKFTFKISKTTEISDKIRELQIKYGVPNRQTIVDSDGVGGGVADQVNCISFVNNARPKQSRDKRNYDNLKSQCAFMLADKVNDSELSIEFRCNQKEKEEIIEEFEQLKREDSDGKMKLIKKDTMKDNIGRSPDWLDTFIMRMYFELAAPIYAG
jgi:hypothetical protein